MKESAARARTGTQVRVRGGVQLLDDETLQSKNALSLGAEVRMSFALSPLIVALSFDDFFVKDRTLLQIGATAECGISMRRMERISRSPARAA